MDLEDLFHGAVYVIFAWSLCVENFDGESPTRDVKGWSVAIEARELYRKFMRYVSE